MYFHNDCSFKDMITYPFILNRGGTNEFKYYQAMGYHNKSNQSV